MFVRVLRNVDWRHNSYLHLLVVALVTYIIYIKGEHSSQVRINVTLSSVICEIFRSLQHGRQQCKVHQR